MRAGSPDQGSRARPDAIRGWLAEVTDPEIPVLTIEDLGVLREVHWEGDTLHVVITPTYTGCPAMMTIRMEIVQTLREHGIEQVRIEERISPAWTTDWISARAREKLRDYGIAPPVGQAGGRSALFGEPVQPPCPQCGSENTEQVSEFGSTACKALYRCRDCLEPFDYFKCI